MTPFTLLLTLLLIFGLGAGYLILSLLCDLWGAIVLIVAFGEGQEGHAP